MSEVRFANNEADHSQIAAHLHACDAMFVPALSARVDLDEYAIKLLQSSDRFEAWSSEDLTGLVAIYCNDPGGESAFITNVSILPTSQGMGVASRLLDRSISHMRQLGFRRIKLEVDAHNHAAIALYEKHAFIAVDRNNTTLDMKLNL